jgi:hypothetical protein
VRRACATSGACPRFSTTSGSSRSHATTGGGPAAGGGARASAERGRRSRSRIAALARLNARDTADAPPPRETVPTPARNRRALQHARRAGDECGRCAARWDSASDPGRGARMNRSRVLLSLSGVARWFVQSPPASVCLFSLSTTSLACCCHCQALLGELVQSRPASVCLFSFYQRRVSRCCDCQPLVGGVLLWSAAGVCLFSYNDRFRVAVIVRRWSVGSCSRRPPACALRAYRRDSRVASFRTVALSNPLSADGVVSCHRTTRNILIAAVSSGTSRFAVPVLIVKHVNASHEKRYQYSTRSGTS